jgi:Sulfotransferase domain
MSAVQGHIDDLFFRSKRRLLGRYRTRRTHVYGLGSAKSGTHSLVAMFSRNVRARHEPEVFDLIDKIADWRQDRINDTQFSDWIRKRDRRMALEVDSCFLNYEILDVLLREFPDARYILTIRDCYSWLDSLFNHILRIRAIKDPRWQKLPQIWPPLEPPIHAPEEYELKEKGLDTLDRQFSWWTRRISTALTKASAAQLLVVRTDEITKRAFEIADFCGLPCHAVRKDRSHAFASPVKYGILGRIDGAFVEARVEKHCRELMTRFFPEIKSIDDARL